MGDTAAFENRIGPRTSSRTSCKSFSGVCHGLTQRLMLEKRMNATNGNWSVQTSASSSTPHVICCQLCK
eukprot:1755717-Amphidinium_carterae.1